MKQQGHCKLLEKMKSFLMIFLLLLLHNFDKSKIRFSVEGL